MAAREQLLTEIEQAPDFLIEEVLNFLLFIKIRLKQKTLENQASVPSQTESIPSFLSLIEEISSQVPQEQWAKLPSDLSKNLDHYLYGSPKAEG